MLLFPLVLIADDNIDSLQDNPTDGLARSGSASRQLIARVMKRMLPEDSLRAQLEGAGDNSNRLYIPFQLRCVHVFSLFLQAM